MKTNHYISNWVDVRLPILLLALLCSFALSARTLADGAQTGKDAERARAVLDRTAQAFHRAGGVEILFSARTPDGGESSGKICVSGQQFRLEAEGMTTWFDGRTQWTYLHQADEVNISNPTPSELQALNPYAWLTLYKQGYSLAPVSGGLPARTLGVKLTSTSPRSDLHSLTIWVDAADYHPLRVSFTTTPGQPSTDIEVKRYKSKMNFSESYFRFNPLHYPHAEVIDLR